MAIIASQTAGLILAAGAASRMGENKMLLPWAGGTLLGAVTDGLLSAGVGPVVTVLGCRAQEIREAYHPGPQVLVTVNEHWQQGMFTSVQAGLRVLLEQPDWQAFLLQPGDIPCAASVIPALLAAYDSAGPDIVIPTWAGKGGHPALFSRSYGEAILRQTLPRGLKSLIEQNQERVLRLPVENFGVLLDLDTPADYQKAKKELDS